MSMTIYRDNMPVILIDRHIGADPVYGDGIMGADFVRELNSIENQGYYKCEVWINSVGGSVMDGMDIYNAITASKMEVTTRCVGVAASTAGFIFQAGKNRVMNDYSLLMMHNPYGGDDKTLEVIKSSIVTMLSTRCSKSELQISNMMEKETWLDSSDCKDMGLCDGIEISIEVEKEAIENKSAFALYNKLRSVVNRLIEEPKKIEKMLKVKNALNLNEDANEESVLKEIQSLKDKNETLCESIKSKEVELENIQKAKEKADKEAVAIELVENAAKEGRIEDKKEVKDPLVALAIDSPEGVKNMLAAMSVVKIANKMPIETKEAEGRSGWTYSDWEKKDAVGLTNMYKNSREQYESLLNKWIETKNIK